MHCWQLTIFWMLFAAVFFSPSGRLSPACADQAIPAEIRPVWVPSSDSALAAARAEVKSDPSSAGAHARLGATLLSRSDFDAALSSFDTALKLNPRNAEAKAGKGSVLLHKGELATAEQLLREALAQSPDPVRIHYELGLLYQKKGSFDQAIAEFKEGIRKFQQGRR